LLLVSVAILNLINVNGQQEGFKIESKHFRLIFKLIVIVSVEVVSSTKYTEMQKKCD